MCADIIRKIALWIQWNCNLTIYSALDISKWKWWLSEWMSKFTTKTKKTHRTTIEQNQQKSFWWKFSIKLKSIWWICVWSYFRILLEKYLVDGKFGPRYIYLSEEEAKEERDIKFRSIAAYLSIHFVSNWHRVLIEMRSNATNVTHANM